MKNEDGDWREEPIMAPLVKRRSEQNRAMMIARVKEKRSAKSIKRKNIENTTRVPMRVIIVVTRILKTVEQLHEGENTGEKEKRASEKVTRRTRTRRFKTNDIVSATFLRKIRVKTDACTWAHVTWGEDGAQSDSKCELQPLLM